MGTRKIRKIIKVVMSKMYVSDLESDYNQIGYRSSQSNQATRIQMISFVILKGEEISREHRATAISKDYPKKVLTNIS